MAGKFELKKAKNDKYHFNLKAGNGEIILSSQMYATKDSGEGGIESVKNNAADDARYDRLESKNGEPYFVLKAGNGEVVGNSEMYTSASARDNGIESVKENGPDAETKDLTEE